MAKHSKYQDKIIKNYYENREAIALQRISELVTELYLTEGKKRQQHWKTIVGHLEKLGVKPDRIDKLVKADKPEQVAALVQELMAKS
jgi:hypothetical protein